jgi:WD40 repeat protein
LKIATFDAEIHAVCFSPLGDMIAVGLGEAFKGDGKFKAALSGAGAKVGANVVISEQDLAVIHEARDCLKPITAIAFSPEGDTLAVGSEDATIYLYSVPDDYELIGRCVRHTAPISHIDFSADGEWLRSNSLNRDICFWSADDASIQTNLPSM